MRLDSLSPGELLLGLQLENVCKAYTIGGKPLPVLSPIDLTVGKGEFICLTGPSGCGKTTLLHIIAGLEEPSEGRVLIGGRKPEGPGPDRILLFQEPALFPWLDVQGNVEFSMRLAGIPKPEHFPRALRYLEMVKLLEFRHARIHQLSGGMKQRAAIAQALAADSEILLMDEPFASLDSISRKCLQRELQDIWLETGKTILFVTHNIEEAVFLADRIIILSGLPGRVREICRVNAERPRVHDDPRLHQLAVQYGKLLEES